MSYERDIKIIEWLKARLETFTGGKVIDYKRGTKGLIFIVDTRAGSPRYIAFKTSIDSYHESGLNRFLREARKWFIASGHPLILTPFYIISFENRPLICMRYMEISLREYLRNRCKLDFIESLVIAIQIIKGLLYLRSRGIWAHQDLKPSNILMENLSKVYQGYPPTEVHFSLRWRVRIADFGLADAWREVGAPRGTFPYMAPEQYVSKRTPKSVREEIKQVSPKEFNPDVFAVGVILTEMLTGHHPCGKHRIVVEKLRDWNKWKKWAESGRRIIKLDQDKSPQKLKRLIEMMLNPNPQDRPSLEYIFEHLMDLLKEKDDTTYQQLKLVLEYYDKLSNYYLETFSWVDDLLKLALSHRIREIDWVLSRLRKEREKIKKLSNPQEAVLLCKLNEAIGKLLVKKCKNKYRNEIKSLGIEIINVVKRWRDNIKVEHLYPPLIFKCKEIIKKSSLKDFEVHAMLIKYGIELLRSVMKDKEIENIFSAHNEYIRSIYHFTKACILKITDIKKSIEELDKSIMLTPNNATLYYFKALWTYQQIIIEKAAGKINQYKICNMLKIALEACKRALMLDQKLIEPKRLANKINQCYYQLCKIKSRVK